MFQQNNKNYSPGIKNCKMINDDVIIFKITINSMINGNEVPKTEYVLKYYKKETEIHIIITDIETSNTYEYLFTYYCLSKYDKGGYKSKLLFYLSEIKIGKRKSIHETLNKFVKEMNKLYNINDISLLLGQILDYRNASPTCST